MRGSAARGRRLRYCAIATIAFGPLSSIPFVPSVWLLTTVSSSLMPGMMPIRLRVCTRSTPASSDSRSVARRSASEASFAPVARSTNRPGTRRSRPSYGAYRRVASALDVSAIITTPAAPAACSLSSIAVSVPSMKLVRT